jgi:hypothetical protein
LEAGSRSCAFGDSIELTPLSLVVAHEPRPGVAGVLDGLGK